MLIFKWDPRLELGIELIDQQHKNIINEVNAFFISYKCGNPKSRLTHCLSFLEQFVMYHFQAEESFQAQYLYPGYLRHQAQHLTLHMQFRFHATTLVATSFGTQAIDEFYDFMRDWITAHILTEDMKFADFCRAQHATLLPAPPESEETEKK